MKKENKGMLSGCNGICAFYFISQDAVDVLTDMDLVHEILDNPEKYGTQDLSEKGDDEEDNEKP